MIEGHNSNDSRQTQQAAHKEERKQLNHPWQPTKLNGWNSVCVSVDRHHIMASYDDLLTNVWSLNRTSLAMIPEQCAIN